VNIFTRIKLQKIFCMCTSLLASMVNKKSVYINVENFEGIVAEQDTVFLFWLKGHLFNSTVSSHFTVNMYGSTEVLSLIVLWGWWLNIKKCYLVLCKCNTWPTRPFFAWLCLYCMQLVGLANMQFSLKFNQMWNYSRSWLVTVQGSLSAVILFDCFICRWHSLYYV
jgi:hypothetical protein